jgi:hypothetical protein
MTQEYIVYAIIAIALVYVLSKFIRKFRSKKLSPCDNCSGCALKDQGIKKITANEASKKKSITFNC